MALYRLLARRRAFLPLRPSNRRQSLWSRFRELAAQLRTRYIVRADVRGSKYSHQSNAERLHLAAQVHGCGTVMLCLVYGALTDAVQTYHHGMGTSWMMHVAGCFSFGCDGDSSCSLSLASAALV